MGSIGALELEERKDIIIGVRNDILMQLTDQSIVTLLSPNTCGWMS